MRARHDHRRRGRVTRELLAVLRMLARGRHGADEIADALGLTRRSVYRIVLCLEQEGLRIEHQREGRRVYLRALRSSIEWWLWSAPLAPPTAKR